MKTVIDDILTKVQLKAAKGDLREAVQRELGNEIRAEAARIARKYVKDNKEKITKELKGLFAKELKADFGRIVKEAVKNAEVCVVDRW